MRLSCLAMVLIMCCPTAVGAQSAGDILKVTGANGGLVVHLGCGDGKLVAALCANDSYLVHGLDKDVADVEKARDYISGKGLYGKVSVEQWSQKVLPYNENVVNLLIAEDAQGVSMDEIMRVLSPNGVACLKQGGKWRKTTKLWPDLIE